MEATTQQQLQVQRLLRWNGGQYSQFMYECGLAYLDYYTNGESAEIVRQISASGIFWNWWRLNWQNRDAVYMESMLVPISVTACRDIYIALHDPEALASELYPNGQVLGESYAMMIAELNETALQEA